MPKDPEVLAHLEWIGFVQPVGLVVSIPALLNAEVYANRNVAPLHQKFLSCLQKDAKDQPLPKLVSFPHFALTVLDWDQSDLIKVDALPPSEAKQLELVLPEYQESLTSTFAVPELKPSEGQPKWQMLIKVLEDDADFDEVPAVTKHGWHASPQAKFERLLRETEIPVGLLVNAQAIRLVYSPRGETSGFATFQFTEMIGVAGRPILAALHMLISADRLFLLQDKQRLPAILAESRKYQNTVSTKLAEQILDALYELLRGLQSANDVLHGELLGDILRSDPNHVYEGLLTVLMRLVFLLYAEDRGLLSTSRIYTEFYSVSRLFERLREDAGRYPDTMDQRFGSWAQLLTLFRLLYDGGSHGEFQIPSRKGHLFDPHVYPFLEGRTTSEGSEAPSVPQISDGVLFRVLSNLLILDGERLSYRSLDVEQIGSVYEAIMGFSLEVAKGTSIAIKPKKANGAPTTIGLEDLLLVKPADRTKWLAEYTDQDLSGPAAQALKEAKSHNDLLIALERKIARSITPQAVSRGHMILQPSSERRKTGSHYTPRILTEPIVRTTLNPIIEGLGPNPTPKQILDIKVCDPAMGSGAFLVEACRQLADELVKAWNTHKEIPPIPVDEDEVLHARRLIAQRCLYGVDKNPMAVNLAKLSLWLITLAKEHPFTFVDHNFRCGDSLVGLSRQQLWRFHWESSAPLVIDANRIKKYIDIATERRQEILDSADNMLYPILQLRLKESDDALELIRVIGNAVISAFFDNNKQKERIERLNQLLPSISLLLDRCSKTNTLTSARLAISELQIDLPVTQYPKPFHWDIEFPEVFSRPEKGFDCIVGNPPFIGGSRISTSLGDAYRDWLPTLHDTSHGNADLVAHFFRRAFDMLKNGGTLGLIATNTIAQGDTRITGLEWICTHGGIIYSAIRRYVWPGQAAVIVSIVNIIKTDSWNKYILDGKGVPTITAFLRHSGGHLTPQRLRENANLSFGGMKIYGQGFLFDDMDKSDECSSLARMREIIAKDPTSASLIKPYMGGEEINDTPTHSPHRFVIDFNDMSLDEAARWPDLLEIVRQKVKPIREKQKREARQKYWWQYGERNPGLRKALDGLKRSIVCCQISKYLSFVFVPTTIMCSHRTVVIADDSYARFAVLQSRVHLEWSYFQGSSMKDDPVYTSSDTFETFPFPKSLHEEVSLEKIGEEYYAFRSELLKSFQIGLTDLYNRFHDPDETSESIVKLRGLHDELDNCVFRSYGWSDLESRCDFTLDYDEADDEQGAGKTRIRRKPWRWRWNQELRDEVIARLMQLNAERMQEAQVRGEPAKRAMPKKRNRTETNKTTNSKTSKPLDTHERQLTLTEIDQ